MVWEDTDGASVSKEPYRQTLTIHRLGYGHDR
jgi:hypothetical protein